MSRLCLIGLHGAGKSTVGQLLAEQGYWHISIGALRRLARMGMQPSDISVRLMARLREADPGRPLPDDVAAAVVELAMARPRVVLDGLPSSPSHLVLLDSSWRIVLVQASDKQRRDRLRQRAVVSRRAWTAGGMSARDLQLESVLQAAGVRIERFDNDRDLNACREDAAILSSRTNVR
ncbi:AAA family ATPase [Cupriavidus sp. CuC1]|uniref:AAA family ATPase n=1 Tax=Cupriavidus sp. CuC1 TaxID=3373131 RepID=UPI0037D430E4